MLSRIRERLTLVLIGLLPLHAFLVTVFTRMIAGPGQAPLSWLALWKEALLGLIFLLILAESLLSAKRKEAWRLDWLDLLLIVFTVLALIVSLRLPGNAHMLFYGIRYDLVPLAALFLARRVLWSQTFIAELRMVVVGVGAFVAAYGLLALVLPAGFFRWLGYSDLHSLYTAGGPIAPYQQIGGTTLRRAQSTMSGPNQLGMWLLLPFAFTARQLLLNAEQQASFSSRVLQWLKGAERNRYLTGFLVVLIAAALIATLSRAAWIAAFLLCVVLTVQAYPREQSRRAIVRLFGVVVFALLLLLLLFPQVLLRFESTLGHAERPLLAVQRMVQHPLGLGLGAAGPASNRVSDTCVELPAGADASWAESHPELCVYIDGMQVQPVTRTCQCPFLPENWYLQIGVETGVIGFFLYLTLVIALLSRLLKRKESLFCLDIGTVFAAVSVAALVLHAWEDSAVAYTVWLLIGVCLSVCAPPQETTT